MSRLFSLTILLLATTLLASAQTISSPIYNDKVDSVSKEIAESAHYIAHYEYSHKMPGDNFAVIPHEMLLFIGDEYLRYTNKYSYQADTLVDNTHKAGMKSFGDIIEPYKRLLRLSKMYPEDLLANTKEQKLKTARTIVSDTYIYEEALPQQEWQLTEGDSTILGYACKRAETSFRGRKYVAWYAPELELPYGPWKFGGLPGLIFDVVDSEGEHRHTLRGLEALSVYTPIYWEPSEPRRTKTGYKREEVRKILYNYAKDPAAYLRQLEGVRFEEKDLQEMKPRPYNPQELE